jgi:polysaccharide pyruvyl transferase WcaK-like protein
MADHRSYRDEKSKAFVTDVLGIDTSQDAVTPDLVFGLDLDPSPPPGDEVRTIGIGAMEYHNWLGSSDPRNDVYEPYMEKLSTFCAGLLEQGKALRILTGDTGDARAVDDLVQRLKEKAPAQRDAVAVPEIRSLRELCREIGKTDVVIATRYHTVVGALICGRPIVSIGYAMKNKTVMGEFGQGEYCQNIWDFDLDRLRSHTAAVNINRAAIREQLRFASLKLRKQVQDHLDRIALEIDA